MPTVLRLDHGGMSLWLSSAGRPEELLYRGFIGFPSADGRLKISPLLHNNLFELCEDC